jgi:subtilisin family serine protease
MRLRLLALAAGAGLALATASAHAAPSGRGGASLRAWPRGEATIGYRSEAALRVALRRRPALVVERIPALRIARVRPSADVEAFAAAIAREPGIVSVERLVTRERHVEPALLPQSGRSLPWEWQYAATRADKVPLSVLRAASTITIAVVDTGADLAAPDIAAKAPTVFNERNGSVDVRDTVGHGTFVSALAAGSVTNGDGIAGFGGDAKLLVVKAGAGDGSLTDVDEASALVYAVDRGARIVNLSFGGPQTSTVERRAIDYAVSHGALIVAAAGNEYLNGNPVEYPAALLQPVGSRGVGGRGLSVGASTMSGTRATFSNTGSFVSLAAPGEDVFSAVSAASSAVQFPRVMLPGASGLYGFASGTSFSSPEVAGAAALVWAANPLLDAAAVAQVLKDTASNLGQWSPELGWGVIDVGNAVARAMGAQTSTAAATITLGGSVAQHRAKLTAALRSSAPGVATSARIVALEQWDGVAWGPLQQAATAADGDASFRLKLVKRGTYRLRARWGGSGDLAGAVSAPLALRVS